MSGIKQVFGGAGIKDDSAYASIEAMKELLDVLRSGGVKVIDTAQLYGSSEEWLGKVKAGDSFTVDTKAVGGFEPGSGTKEKIVAGAKKSLERLQTNKVRFVAIACNEAGRLILPGRHILPPCSRQ